ncbi:MAG TPA: choice-of-anchor D domain-containing protein [Gaiellaceae bacterium]|nr:choice-of-anchor D domain-containing protein [Gaiellaceae bacterium]
MLSAVVALACAGTADALTFAAPATSRPTTAASPSSIDFGTVQIPLASDPVTVTLTNSGAGTLSFWRYGIASSSANPADFAVVAGGTCTLASTLAGGESCTVLVRFRPTATGARTGLLSFWDNTAAGRTNVALAGTGLPVAAAALAPDSVDFGPVQLGTSSDLTTVTLSSSGGGILSFWRYGIASSSPNAGDFAVVPGGTCDVSVPVSAGGSCTVMVRFRPTSTGARNGLLSFWDNTATGRHDVTLTGSGLPAAASSLAPTSVDFGALQVGLSSAPVPVILTNSGSGTLSFWRFGIASSSANAGDFSVVAGGTCTLASTLASGESCTVLVRFRPTSDGARSGLLSFWDNTVSGRINAALTGVALPGPVSSLSPAAVDFGTLPLGASSDAVVITLTNSGAGSLSFWRFGIASSSVNAGDFWIVPGGSCALSVTLTAGQTCTVLVRFRPTAGGARSGLLSFWDNTLLGRIDAALSGNGDDPCAQGCF